MKKNKEDAMTDLEIIKKNFNIITESEGYDYWYELEKEALDAATRMAAEIERLKVALASQMPPDDLSEFINKETERADGLTVCCETCKHYEKFCANYCQKGCFSGIDNDNINLGQMKCNEWQAREGR